MKRTKRVFIIAVIFSMVFGLVACGGSTTSKYPVEEQALTIDQFSNPDYDYEDYQKMFPSGFVVKKRKYTIYCVYKWGRNYVFNKMRIVS